MANKKDGLTPKQYEAINLLVHEKMTVVDCAKALKVNRVTVFNWFGDATFLYFYNQELDKIQQQAQAKAMEKIIELALGDNKSVALKASQDILDRAGRKPVDKSEVKATGISINIGSDNE